MKILKIFRSDLVLTLLGGLTIGFLAMNISEDVNAGHSHIYGETRSVTVEQSFADNYN